MYGSKRRLPALNEAALQQLALRYVERFATTRARLVQYLIRKIKERGWEGAPADPKAIAERLAELGYVDDRAYAEAKARSMGRRGLGERRIRGALFAAGVDAEEAEALIPELADRAVEAALHFAKRRRIGPFADTVADRPTRERHLAAMLRAGHAPDLAQRIVRLAPGQVLDES